ncbi:MAG: hypothetical protein HY855_03930 [Burkholderiales bacterium]|nr:hypothetical protein [Burkholderiales bacterium]
MKHPLSDAAALVVAGLAALGPAAAQPAAPAETGRSMLSAACQADLKKLCPDVAPGGGRVAACLKGKKDQLSPTCKADLAQRAAGGPAPASR